jgi:Lon protease-like protein
MVRVEALDGGRYAIVAVGTRRIRINAWLPDDPYPIADVDDWPDDDVSQPGLNERVGSMTSRLREVLSLAAQLGETPADIDLGMISEDPLVASYHLATLAPLGPADSYRLLCAPGPAARLDGLDAALDDVEAVLRFRLGGAPD